MYTELVKFAQYLASEDKSQFTIEAYVKDIEQLLLSLPVDNITKITEDTLKGYIDKLIQSKTFEKKTISRKVNSIRKFVSFINRKYKLNINATSLKSPKPLIKKQRILKQEEINSIRSYLRDDVKCFTMFEVLLQSGIRISELAHLSKYDVDLTKRQIEVPMNGSKPRIIPMNDKLYYILKDYLANIKDKKCDYIFHTSNLKPIQIRNIRAMLDRAFKKSGVEKVMVNDLRNTFIVRQIEALNNVNFISEVVGHTSLSATLRYEKLAHISNGKKRDRKEIVEI